MFRIQEVSQFAAPRSDVAQALPSAALAGAAWTQTTADPFFAEINAAALGYRHVPKRFASTIA